MKKMKAGRKPITYLEKLRWIEEIEKNPNEKRNHIAKRLGISPSTLTTIYMNKAKIREHAERIGAKRKSCKNSKFQDLEEILFSCYQENLAANDLMNGTQIREKALEIAESLGISDFSASHGWISRFKERHGLSVKKYKKFDFRNCEQKYFTEGSPSMVPINEFSSTIKISCDFDEPANCEKTELVDENLSNWYRELPTLLEGYHQKNIYSLHETGLFYFCLPDTVFVLKDECCKDGRRSKERLSVLLCSNSDGSQKLSPIVVGKSPKPRCFKNLKTLPLEYHYNAKCWFTRDILSSFLKYLDEQMEDENRKIILILIDCEMYQVNILLKNIKLVYLPFAYSRMCHPLNGVLSCFKVNYRRNLIKKAATLTLDNISQTSVRINVLQAMHLIKNAWDELTPIIINDSFSKCGFPNVASNMQYEECKFIPDEWERVVVPPGVDFYSYVHVDDNLFTAGEVLTYELSQGLKKIVDGVCRADERLENSYTTKKETQELEKMDDNSQESIPTFLVAYNAFQTVKSFLYSNSLTETSKSNIAEIENLLQSFNANSKDKT